METNPSPFIPSGTGNISPKQAEWRGLSPNVPVEVMGEGVVVKNNSMEELGLGTRLKWAAVPALVCQQRPQARLGEEEAGQEGGEGSALGDLPGPQGTEQRSPLLFSFPSSLRLFTSTNIER